MFLATFAVKIFLILLQKLLTAKFAKNCREGR
jgi:hypothetical protein